MKILIIGAGTAGITAGHLLAQHEVDFEILEASSTHGGRVRKVDNFADFPIDLGAEWIHKWIKAKPAVFTQILKGADPNFPTFPDKPTTISIWKNGKLRARNWYRHFPVPTDLKFTDSTWFDALNRLATPAVLAKTRFDSPVVNINYSNDRVVATTASGTSHDADRVLVTVPIAMLQRETIRFEPPLPEDKRSEIQKEEVPGGLKAFIEFSTRFYPDVLLVGGLRRGSALNECVYYDAARGKHSDRHILGFFTQGSAAERYTSYGTDEQLFAHILRELNEIFDGQASEHYVQHIVQDWTREPYIQGSYSQRKANAEKLAESVAGRVFFAGEAMNPNGKTIAVHGASESAYTAVAAMTT